MDFIEKHPCIAISIVGILLILLSFFIEQLAAYGLFVFLLLYLAGVILVVINIAAMLLVANDMSAAGVILSLLFGGLGAMIGLLFNPSYDKEKAVKIIFSIQLWLVIWALASAILYALNYYSIGPLPG